MCFGDGNKQKNKQKKNHSELIIKIRGYGKQEWIGVGNNCHRMVAWQPINAEVITDIAGQCGIDENSVMNIAAEVIAAKDIAEEDMKIH